MRVVPITEETDQLEAAFEQLKQGLHGYLRKRLPEPALADDLLQDVFVKALAARQEGRDIGNLTGWLYQAARTTLADYYRSAAKQFEALDDDIASPEDEDLQVHHEFSDCLRPMINQLPANYRDTLLAIDLEGKSMRELAEAEGLSVSAIKSRAVRGRAMLRDKLTQCCHIDVTDGLVSDYRLKSRARHKPGC
jgi:RNA polymerase sigma-70 factor (ECF subfamily)